MIRFFSTKFQVIATKTAVNRLWLNRTLPLNNSVPFQPRSKRMHQSFVQVFLSFKSDPSCLGEYLNVYQSIRFGKILEDLDALAGSIAYQFNDNNDDSQFPTNVTASLDKIDLIKSIPTTVDIRISGFVSFVGHSSMEITINLETCPEGAPIALERSRQLKDNWPNQDVLQSTGDKILVANFTFVGLKDGKATPVNQLNLVTDTEVELFNQGKKRKLLKLEAKQNSLSINPPSESEMKLIHDLYKEWIQYLDPSYHKTIPSNIVWMKNTIQSSLIIMMPQDRNIHNDIFGGYLMRCAYELAFATALLFGGVRPTFTSLGEITFIKPVKIGSLLSLTGQVVYSSGDFFHVKVRADVLDPKELKSMETTNTFFFRFMVPNAKQVCPRSYDEAMRYIEGRRREIEHQ